MDIGLSMFATDLAIQPAELAPEVEARGFSTLYFPEHTHIPTSRLSPWANGPVLPEEYKRTHDPFVALATAAALTERIQIGTSVCLVAERDPIVTAKQVASLDMMSGGRFVFGIGVGWNREEMEDHGVDPDRRRATVRDKVLAMKTLWTEDEAEYKGEFVSFSKSWSWPKPVQKPNPPIFMGGVGGPVTFRHIIEYCDGWFPFGYRGPIGDKVAEMRVAAEKAGRDPDTVRIKSFGPKSDPALLEEHAALGAEEAVLLLPPRGADEVLPVLDRYAEFIGKF
jgi:probable F420-dependent oxidoreductase